MKRMTHKQIIEHWEYILKTAQWLWRTAASDILVAVKNRRRARARAYCQMMAKKYSTMAISGYYTEAAKQLK